MRRLNVPCQKSGQRIDIAPDLVVSFLPGLAKDPLQTPVPVRHSLDQIKFVDFMPYSCYSYTHEYPEVQQKGVSACYGSFNCCVR